MLDGRTITHTHKGTENLIPLKDRTPEFQREFHSKGGKTVTEYQRFKCKLREMKKRGLDDADIQWMCERLEDPKANSLHMENALEETRNSMQAKDYIMLLDKLHNTRFGTKSNNINYNINQDIPKDTAELLLDAMFNKEEQDETNKFNDK